MIRFIYGDSLSVYPALSRSMFFDRARIFADRLCWEVSVDTSGEERDSYDNLNPLYLIWQAEDGGHGGSLRLLPTTGPTMANDHFAYLIGEGTIVSPLIWEATRFCVAPELAGDARIPAALMLAAAEVGKRAYLSHALGVFDARMERVYQTLGWSPEVIGRDESAEENIAIGLWDFAQAPCDDLAARAEIDPACMAEWYSAALGPADLA